LEPDLPVEFTSAVELRALFNTFVWPRVVTGELAEVVLESSDPSARANQPLGTKSQTVGYFWPGERVALAHRYLLKDGSLGGSGAPDPKMMVHEGLILLVE
jgi:hypothetical protein